MHFMIVFSSSNALERIAIELSFFISVYHSFVPSKLLTIFARVKRPPYQHGLDMMKFLQLFIIMVVYVDGYLLQLFIIIG